MLIACLYGTGLLLQPASMLLTITCLPIIVIDAVIVLITVFYTFGTLSTAE
jgi:hypothetical protein